MYLEHEVRDRVFTVLTWGYAKYGINTVSNLTNFLLLVNLVEGLNRV